MDITRDVGDALRENGTIVVTAPPGAGKSTLLPLTILESIGGKILMLEPRRLAARQVAGRMAWLLGEQPGATVGYRIRFENRISSSTQIEVITEGILTRMLLDDPTLEGVSVLVFDEFHERSLQSDEALAMAREVQRELREDLKIVVMSATMDTDSLCRSLDAPLLESHGRSWPVEIIYSDKDILPQNCAEEVARAVFRAHAMDEGDILAFLPGEAEIRKCVALLDGELGTTTVFPLYGMLPMDQQNRAIAPSPSGCRKVVLATSIAETSLTIEGVRVVVDSGLYRTRVYDARNGQSHMETVPVSRDMADQRSGRAGRVAPGKCYRLYRSATERSMKACRIPEILEADLVPLALDVYAWGGGDMMELPWLTPPPEWKVSSARSTLQALGALDGDGRLSEEGRRLSAYPCHPRLARMLVRAAGKPKAASLAADLAALLEERDVQSQEGVDIALRIDALRQARRGRNSVARLGRALQAADQFRRMTGVDADNGNADIPMAGMLLASAYPERIGKSEGCGRYTLASGDKVFLDMDDPVASSDWIVAVSANIIKGGTGRVLLAAALDDAGLKDFARVGEKVVWDPRQGAVVAVREWRIGSLLLDSKPLDDVGSESVLSALCDAALRQGLSMFDFSDGVTCLQRRIELVRGWHPELQLPDLSTASVLDRVREWLPLYAGKARTAAELKRIDMEQVIWGLLDYDMQSAVDRLAPTHMTVPSGSRIRLDYRPGAEVPVLKVRLQECFGLLDTPKVDGGRRPILMELLSPGFKPVQLTKDLASFWSGTYFEVRKELRRRYPKHNWPDNPLDAVPKAGRR